MTKFGIGLIIYLFSTFALACKCDYRGLEKNYANADMVLWVRVMESKFIEKTKTFASHTVAKYEVVEVFKGTPETDKTVSASWGDCSPGLIPGSYYVLFISQESRVSRCTGSFLINHYRGELGRSKLAEVRELSN